MAYFPNGTAKMLFEDAQCHGCVHFEGRDGHGCPVMNLHTRYTSDELSIVNVRTRYILDTIIPMDKEFAGDCTMFYPTPAEAAK
jgi:hypothetical protein